MNEITLRKEAVYEVVSPQGSQVTKAVSAAPSIPDLNGKTIGVSGPTFRGDKIGAAVVEMLKQRYPGMKYVPHAEIDFRPAKDVVSEADVKLIQNVAKQKGCDAFIVGVGC